MDGKVTVSNTGGVDADDAVLGFLVPPGAGMGGVPLQTLYGFTRVHVKAGQSVTVSIPAQYTDFSVVGRDAGPSNLPPAIQKGTRVRISCFLVPARTLANTIAR